MPSDAHIPSVYLRLVFTFKLKKKKRISFKTIHPSAKSSSSDSDRLTEPTAKGQVRPRFG